MEDSDKTTIVKLGVINRVTVNENCLIFETMNGERIPAFYEIDTLLDLLKKHFALKNDPIELLIDKKSENVLDIRMLNFDGHASQSPGITEEDFRDRCPYLYERMKFFRDNPRLGIMHNPYDFDDLRRHMLLEQSIIVEPLIDERHELLLKDPFLFEWFDRASLNDPLENKSISPLRFKVLELLRGNTYLVAAHDPDNPHLGHHKFYAVLGSKKSLDRLNEMDPDPNSYVLVDIEPFVSNFFEILIDAWESSFPNDDFPFFTHLPSLARLSPMRRPDAIKQFFFVVTRKTQVTRILLENIKKLSRDHHKYPRTIKESTKINPKDKSNTYPIEPNRPSFYTDDEIEGGLSDYLGDNYFD